MCTNCETNRAAAADTEHWCKDSEQWCEDCSEEFHAYNSLPSTEEDEEDESSPETDSNCDYCAVAVTTTGDHAFDDCWGFLANGGVLCNSCGHNCDGCDATTLKVDLKEGGDGWLCKACQEPEEEEETDEEYLPQECEAYLSRFSSDKKCDNVGSFAVWNEDEQEQANLHVCTHCYDHLCLKLEACEDEPTA